ncbi:MAG: HAD hydrolase-like protein [Desulfovibrionaceae bacterium]|nr:HAD hydrolase-like protein [Desulfovibrionaceae bacterium]
MNICSGFTDPAMFRRVKGVIFDCDGVILDSRDANRMYYSIIRERMGLLPITGEEEDYVHAHSVMESLARVIPRERLDEANELRKHFDYREILPYLYLYDGLTPFLETLQENGVLMAVNTNRTDTMEMVLDIFELRRFFAPVITAAKVSHPKPNPEGVHKILAQWNLRGQDVAYLGDSFLDEQTARAARVPFWAFKNPALIAELHVPNFELLRRCWLGGDR